MVEDNIFDIDIPSDDNDKKSPNTEVFFELTNILLRQAKICDLARQMAEMITAGMIEKAGIQHVEFSPLNNREDALYDRIADGGNRVPEIVMIGEDDDFCYVIKIKPDYGGNVPSNSSEPEPPAGAGASLVRSHKDPCNPEAWQYDFEKDYWNPISCIEFTGFTENQFKTIHEKKEFSPKAMMIFMARDRYGVIDDEDTDMLYEKNKEIIRLYSCTKLYTSMSWILDRKDQIMIRPLANDAKSGLGVIYENGIFKLYTSVETKLVDCVFETPDINKMIRSLNGMLNRKFEHETKSIVPLSPDSIAILNDKTGCRCANGEKQYTKEDIEKEDVILNRYMKAYSQMLNIKQK